MKVAERAHIDKMRDGDADQDGGRSTAPDVQDEQKPAPSPTLSPEMAGRLHALIDAVTDELMRGLPLDRQVTRSDAIALLIATSQQLENETREGQSPLMYLLMEEQQKMAALLGNASIHAQGPAFVKV